ncbi:MAG: hypothetical protein A3F82_10360 [Deltaproteobacteria bacterium RIFCSPLOWO2_12_FULL_44_12]|nr:MAG: hypothetical protein A2712_07710 [Deltaproteobacteria bacterium RIFCSPHIGHO2_01_FULL_43_49]OGQ14772.1 MAG: hypothetical protein A3D22_09285 [Deltaproteobacteria bacterium RIFCSPHIGHO2_02_FULL_44_53]OGQ28158.1 MAG: hypothetical protein A3D98_07995 [Deltaproteobacteria bacterium RIFCSPHIGHO2_12_FULL_44_21]OGQ31370.1 MAG: hypothetical protein A2979_08045 [Deltaproteobacteria bacterium RIFCSPLOWO2_01_FULL_45_74]OGQ43362.1 MAG: hypothetical protein A3I70_01705 [Deltaproteobacteria bacterium 
MKTLFKTILVFLIPCIAFAVPLNPESRPRKNRNTNYQAGCPMTPNLILSDRNDIVVFCGQALMSMNAVGGNDIVAACTEGVDGIRINNGQLYISFASTEGVEGTNGDDIIILCRDGVTVNGLGGNDIIVQCPNKNSFFIF